MAQPSPAKSVQPDQIKLLMMGDLFDSLQKLPLSYFDQHPHGELMSRFTNDADNAGPWSFSCFWA